MYVRSSQEVMHTCTDFCDFFSFLFWYVYKDIEWNPGKSNPEGQQTTVQVSGSSSYHDQLKINVHFAMLHLCNNNIDRYWLFELFSKYVQSKFKLSHHKR